jgi:acid stress chaperone HdeB
MKKIVMALGLIFACLGVSLSMPAAHAQMTVDVAKITCKQFLLDKVAPTKSVAIWLSGYYNGKRGNTVIDLGDTEKKADKVEDYCRLNLDMTVMDAVQKTLGLDK